MDGFIPPWTQLLCNVSLANARQTLKIAKKFTWKFFKLFNRTWITHFGVVTGLLNPTVEGGSAGGRAEGEAIVSYYQ